MHFVTRSAMSRSGRRVIECVPQSFRSQQCVYSVGVRAISVRFVFAAPTNATDAELLEAPRVSVPVAGVTISWPAAASRYAVAQTRYDRD